MVTFDHVKKLFGSVVALSDVTFHIAPGEFVFFVGPSGAGKTTVMRLLIREYLPSEGDILFSGTSVLGLKQRDIPRLRSDIGLVFQDFQLFKEKTVRENLEVMLAVKGVEQDEWQARIEHVLGLVGLADRVDQFPGQLSGGESQRAAIARALVTGPELIFADEPTGNLDWDTASGVMELLKKINDEGKTIIVTTHHKKLVDEYRGRVITLENGKVKSDTGKTKKSPSGKATRDEKK